MAQDMKISVIRQSGQNITINVNEKETFQQFHNRILKQYNLCLTKDHFSSLYPTLSSSDNFYNHLKQSINITNDNTNESKNVTHIYEINLLEGNSHNMGTMIKMENASTYGISDESMESTPTEPYSVYTVPTLNNTLMGLNHDSNTHAPEYTNVLNDNIFATDNYQINSKEVSIKKTANTHGITLYGENDKVSIADQYQLIKNNPAHKNNENKQEARDSKMLLNDFGSDKCMKNVDPNGQAYTYMDIESKLREIHSYSEENVADFCRLCAVNIVEENKMFIYKENDDGENLSEKINSALPIVIAKDDGLPQQVCQGCGDRASNFHDFIQMVLQADKVLRLKFISADNAVENLKDTAVSDFMSEFLTASPLNKSPTVPEPNKNVKFEPNDLENYETEYLEIECDVNEPDTSILKCRMCDLVFENFMESVSHSFKSHNMKGVIACCFCEYGYSTVTELSAHVESYHQKNFELHNMRKIRRFQCNVCSKRYTSQSQLGKHTCTKNTLNKTLHCEICNQEFHTKVRLNVHRQFHVKDVRPLFCSLCNITFKDENEYFDHVHFIHENRKIYVCDLCDKTFSIRSALKNHKRIHSGIRNYKCDLCDKSFLDKQTLKEHKVSHMETKPYQCHICGKNLNRLSRLKKHLLTHESNPVVSDVQVCSLCKEAFPDEQAAQFHQSYQHENTDCIEVINTDKVFRCEFCEKCYSNTTALNNHRSTHTGLARYTCHICKAQFSSYSRCTTHKITHGLYKDGAEKNNYPVVKHFLCEHCGKSYLHWSYLGLHRRLKHSDNVHMYKCTECNLEFPTSWGVAYHRKSKHNQDQYKCTDCGKHLSNYHSLKLHQITHHANNKDKDIRCHKCGKQFTQQGFLELHLKLHEGIKKYKCRLCSKSFVHLSNLSNHIKLHKSAKYLYANKQMVRKQEGESRIIPLNQSKTDNLDRPYTCDVCGLSFRRQYILRNHKLKHNCDRDENSFVLMVDMKEDLETDDDVTSSQNAVQQFVQPALTEAQGSSNDVQLELSANNALENYINLGNGNYLQIQGNTFNIDGKEYILIDEDGKPITRNQFEMVVSDDENVDTNGEISQLEQNDETVMLVEPNDSYALNLNDPQSEFLFTTADTILPKSNTTYVIGNQFMLEANPNMVD